jgi:hypothetical protein
VDGQSIVGDYSDNHSKIHGFVISIADVEKGQLTPADFAAVANPSVGAFVPAIWGQAKLPLFGVKSHRGNPPPIPQKFTQSPENIAQTPEPATVTLFAIGIVGVAWYGSRRRKSRAFTS